MKILEVFTYGNGRVTALRRVKITNGGASAEINVGSSINLGSSVGGVSGQWIVEHLADNVPSNWTVT